PRRRERLAGALTLSDRIRLTTAVEVSTPQALDATFEQAIADGCEGLLCKSVGPDSGYKAGARGWQWIKLKRDYRSELSDTVDLTVVGAFAGRGRRTGLYGAVLLAAYDADADLFRAVTKAGAGFPDAGPADVGRRLARPAGGRGRDPGLAVLHRLAAGLAGQLGDEAVAAGVVQDQRRAVLARQVLVAPGHQRGDDRVEVAAGRGQVVLEAGRVLAVGAALEDAGAGQGLEPGGERVARRPGAADHLVEPAVAEEDLAQRQQRPLLPDDVQGARDRAGARVGCRHK